MRLKSVGMGYFLAVSDAISILNLVSGFLAILMVMSNHLDYASVCILLAIVFDSVDGWVSRKLNREDPFGFGKNIDSLADIVSFGVAPSVILYSLGSNISSWGGYLIAIVAIFTLVCGILRLTRYNVVSDRLNYNGFIGFPIPGTAIILVSYYLSGLFNIVVAAVLMILAGYLMISTIRYPKLDNYYIIGIGAVMIILLLLPVKILIGFINVPALILFVFSLVYMFMTFLEFFIDEDMIANANNTNKTRGTDAVTNVKEITSNGINRSFNAVKDGFNNMRSTINQISNEDLDVGRKDVENEEKEEKEQFVEE